MPRLTWIHPTGGEPIELGDRPIVFGRDEACDVQVLDVRSSRRQFLVEPCEDGHRIVDLESANGTRVNESRVRQRRLGRGDEIRVGEWRLCFETRSEDGERARPVRRAPAYSRGMLLVPIVVAAVGAVGLALFDRVHQERIARARDTVAQSALDAAFAEPDATAQREALLAWIEAHPNDEHLPQARAGIERIADRFQHEREAGEELARLLGAEGLDPGEMRSWLDRFVERFGDVAAVMPEARRRLREVADAERAAYAARLEAARFEAARRAGEGDFGGAMATLNGFLYRNESIDAATREAAEQEADRVYRAALEAWRRLEAEVTALAATDREAAAERLRDALGRWAGTPYHADIRLRIEELAAAATASSAPGSESAEAEAERRQTRATYYLRARRAEELARIRAFGDAAARLREVLEGCEIPEIVQELGARIGDLEACAALVKRLREEMETKPKKFLRLELGAVKGNLAGVDDRDVRIEAKGGVRAVPWVDVSVRELVRLVDRIKPTPEESLALAVIQFDGNDRAGWRETIHAVMEGGALKERVDDLYARKEGLSMPEGGFVAYRGLILTAADHRRELRRERIITLNNEVAEVIARLDATEPMKQVAAMRKRREALDEARRHALELIFDEVKYFYPYQQRMGEYTPVQREVDDRVAAVRKLWDDEVRIIVRRTGDADRWLARGDQVVAELRQLEVDPATIVAALERRRIYLAEDKTTFTIRTFFVDAEDRDRIAYDERVLAYNASDAANATLPEAAQVDVTNAYRMMFARRAVVRDDLLVLSARKHSEEMGRLGYFSHFSPVEARRDPFTRTRIEGYKGMPVSENIHQGSGDPHSAHRSWCHSSGHHRNILNEVWTDLGTGVDGNRWTQNFGHTALLADRITKRSEGR